MMSIDESQGAGTVIKVIGVGGAGGNAINTMISAGLGGVEFIVANTDKQAFANSLADTLIQIGESRTQGLGAGSDPNVGREAAQESQSIISEHLRGAHMVFVAAGMGGGTGTGAAPVIAKIAKDQGALTVAVVTKPFRFEGRKRKRLAEEGLNILRGCVDTLITIPNERLLQTAGENLTLIDAFKYADSVLLNAVRSISELITKTGIVNTDFNDVKAVMLNKGTALMGTGVGNGPTRMVDAAQMAISSPLLDDTSLDGGTSVLLNITSPSNTTIMELNEAACLIEEELGEDGHVIWGQVLRDDDEDEVKITIIATGFNEESDGQMSSGAWGDSYNDMSKPGGYKQSPSQPSFVPSTPSQPSFVPSGTGYAGVQDSGRSNSLSSTDISKLQELDKKSDALYSTPGRPITSYAPGASRGAYAPSEASASLAQIASENCARGSSSAENKRIEFGDDIDSDDRDTPAYLRRSGMNKSFT